MAINDIDHALDQTGHQIIPASVNLPSENTAQPAHITRGSTSSHSPHSSPEATPPPTDLHTGDTSSHCESPTPIDTSPTDTPTHHDPTTHSDLSTGHTHTHKVVAQPRVKLPKLTIKKFNGDLTKWVTFWDSFESAIHSNPTLSNVDKFSYLHSFLESTASDAIASLTLTSANYEEAIATLKRRFGNEQLIMSKHMNALLILQTVASHYDLKGLRHLYDTVESLVRGLRALGIDSESYGQLLSSILMNKLPTEMRLIISRELGGGKWNVDEMMRLINHEIEAREQLTTSSHIQKHPVKGTPPTSSSFFNHSEQSSHCVYCGQAHLSSSCTVVTEVSAKREVLHRSGRCYICLKKHHISRDCHSKANCGNCRGRHHTTICPRRSQSLNDTYTIPLGTQSSSNQTSTNTVHAGTWAPVLLQTARLQLCNPSGTTPTSVGVRAIMDSGSEHTYVSSCTRETLQLSKQGTECLRIKTFGNYEGQDTICDVVKISVITRERESLTFTALVVPFICNPLTTQPIDLSRNHYDHLRGLDLADSADVRDTLETDLLIGSDVYWNLATGRVIRGRSGPLAIQTKVGWVLSGPVDQSQTSVHLTFTATHSLRIDAYPMEQNLDNLLRRF